jgi:hypothetical protein
MARRSYRLLNHDARRIERSVWLSKRGDHSIAAAFHRTEIDKQDLVLIVVDNLSQFTAASREIGGSELAFEDRKLQVISESTHRLKYLS